MPATYPFQLLVASTLSMCGSAMLKEFLPWATSPIAKSENSAPFSPWKSASAEAIFIGCTVVMI